MLSTIVFCEDTLAGHASGELAKVLARTLASLVPAKVEGVLCDVRIAGPAAMGLGIVAHHAGCALIESNNETERLRLAIEAARGPGVFVLRCGRAPEAGFIEEISDFLASSMAIASRPANLRAAPEGIFERLFPSLAPVAGIIAPRDLLLRLPGGGFQEMARKIGSATTFRARARRIG
ncbi:MAG: hypothetical protein L0Y57_10835 [Beijerinckiaceae bacterium]|nr:hypothetical protein [Beijerinckiaceae bacterium]